MNRQPRSPIRSRSARATAAAVLGLGLLVSPLAAPGAADGGVATASLPAAVPNPATRAFTAQNDWSGDGKADVLAATLGGTMYAYRGDGASGWLSRIRIGTGWHKRDEIRLAGDMDGRGGTDILARDPLSGYLWLYSNDGRGTVTGWSRVGVGWSAMRTIVAPGDWDGDGKPDVLAVRASDGIMRLYPGNGSGGLTSPRQISTGWLARDQITPVGDWTGDGKPDLVARDPSTGKLWLYPGNGTGGFLNRSVIGVGWQGMTALRGPGDWNGDGRMDILARPCTGLLRLYRGDGAGGFMPKPFPTLGTGWHKMALTWPTMPVEPVPSSLLGKDLTYQPTTAKVIALTFDGGSSNAAVARIKSTLDAYDVPATFFVTGDFVRSYPADVACLSAGGYPVGNHSNTHAHYPLLTNDQIRADLLVAERAIAGVSGETARPLFRFPYGDRTTADIAVVNGAGYVPFRWTVDSLGWLGTERGGTAQAVADRVVAAAAPGAIVLMHVGANPDDGTTFDADALPQIIQRLRALGYRFVTLDQYVG